jgi:hypothetical protein
MDDAAASTSGAFTAVRVETANGGSSVDVENRPAPAGEELSRKSHPTFNNLLDFLHREHNIALRCGE